MDAWNERHATHLFLKQNGSLHQDMEKMVAIWQNETRH